MFVINCFSNPKVKAVQTTRRGGVSQKPYDSMNLGVNTEDSNVPDNLKILTKKANLPMTPKFLSQVHGKKAIEYTETPKSHGEHLADACFARNHESICAILTADCLPILLSSKTQDYVAAIHCGWQGLYQNLIEETLTASSINGEDIEAWLGPCISYKAYQVGEDFRQKFVESDKSYAHAFYQDKKNNWHADLKKIAIIQLEKLGVTQITQAPFCTYDNKDLFYSYRKNKITGRMASLIWLET